jgi:hypothetical protein
MKLYTCCPHEGCGAFQEALNWLKSWGIEPALEHDGDHHYFEFDFPDDWDTAKRISLKWDLAKKTSGLVFCRCGLWLDENYIGDVLRTQCKDCGREYRFCMACAAVEEWEGCDCGCTTHCTEHEPSQSWTLMKDGKTVSLTVEEVCGLLDQLIQHEQLDVFDLKSRRVVSSAEDLTVGLNGSCIQITVAG